MLIKVNRILNVSIFSSLFLPTLWTHTTFLLILYGHFALYMRIFYPTSLCASLSLPFHIQPLFSPTKLPMLNSNQQNGKFRRFFSCISSHISSAGLFFCTILTRVCVFKMRKKLCTIFFVLYA